jgi:hypothetical protein
MVGMEPDVTRLSDALSEPLTKAYRIGGFGLAFLLLGAIFLTASAATPRGLLSYLIAAVGVVLVVVPCYFFYVKEIRPIKAAQTQVSSNAELIDSVQTAALTTTLAAYELQSLAYRYADEVGELLRIARPAMMRIPLLRRIAESDEFERADWFTGRIVALTQRSERVIADVRQALVDADPTALKKYVSELESLRTELKELLRAPTDAH